MTPMSGSAMPATRGLTRRAAAVLPFALLGEAARAAPTVLATPASLANVLATALRARQPLLVMASLDACPFCNLVRTNYLGPMQREQALPVVQLDLASQRPVLDFDGRPSTHDLLLRRWRVQAAPTVLFFGPGGREVAERLVGASVDFYGAYLEQRLAAARRSLG